MKGRIPKVQWILAAVLAAAVFIRPVGAGAAEAPYTSLTVNKNDEFVSTVAGYLPVGLWDKFGDTTLKKPSDLFIKGDRMYIADTGNGRILICDLNGGYIGEIKELLKGPTGVFVNDAGDVYVADPSAKLIIRYNSGLEVTATYGTPVSPLFGANAKYQPTKLVVNGAGTIYALSKGNTSGIMTISEYGDFYGYFGANDTNLALSERIKRTLFTEDQLSSLQKVVPASATNLDIDTTGLVYTVTQGLGRGGLKKYNMAGGNMLDNAWASSRVADVAVGPYENIYTISKVGFIEETTREGEVLFYFGGYDDGSNRRGLFINAAAIDIDDGSRIYVLDGDRGDITIFAETEYAKTIHKALNLYQDGFYLESKEPWEEVLAQNSLFDFAYRGIAKGLYKLEDYEGSMEAARLGGDYPTYSNAFWQVRNTWLRNNIIYVFWILVAFLILRYIWKKFGDRIPGIRSIKDLLRRFGQAKYVREARFLKYVMKNPADAFYGIKKEDKVSTGTATFMFALVFIIYLVNKYFSGFLFKAVPDGEYDLMTDILMVPGLMLLFVICCNMICSIRSGEATFIQTYRSFAYCFMPYIFLKPVVIVLSHVLTYNESFLISLLNIIMISATVVLIIVMVREIQCFTYKETFISMFLTLFTMLIIAAAGIILIALFRQVIDFVIGIFKEGYYRGR